jgi:hypothetical protein
MATHPSMPQVRLDADETSYVAAFIEAGQW